MLKRVRLYKPSGAEIAYITHARMRQRWARSTTMYQTLSDWPAIYQCLQAPKESVEDYRGRMERLKQGWLWETSNCRLLSSCIMREKVAEEVIGLGREESFGREDPGKGGDGRGSVMSQPWAAGWWMADGPSHSVTLNKPWEE
ncbi:hypothetical protein DPEC_G00002500 [Dallia pectoralis]|uniref:Uncharacterized protein n=1 Tax=Dallia pectoralis TaxID=75939 RepID=A0ACC2HJ48_DALPE|nr:hypothetical protein DPEC_G00002500 [Dallia pectoralis]